MSAPGSASSGGSSFFSTLTQGVTKGAENWLTKAIAAAGGKGAAGLTFRVLVSAARENEALARKLFDLILASENLSVFVGGSIEGILPAIEKMEGTFGTYAHIVRSFSVNLLERGIERFYDEMKKYAEAGDFEGFRDALSGAITATEGRMTPEGDGTVRVLRLDGMKIAFRGEDDPNYRDILAARSRDPHIRMATPPRSAGGDFKATEFLLSPGEIDYFEISFEEMLRAIPDIIPHPKSFPELAYGMGGGVSRHKKSAFASLDIETARKVGIVVARTIEHAKEHGRHIILSDEWSQAEKHCHEKRPFEMIASALLVEDKKNPEKSTVDFGVAETWILFAGGHASVDMVFFQAFDTAMGHILTDYRAARTWLKGQSAFTKEWVKRHHIVERTWKWGKVSAVSYGVGILLFLLSTLLPDKTSGFHWRLGFLFASGVVMTPLVLWLIYIGWAASFGRWLYDGAGELIERIGKKLGLEDVKPKDATIVDWDPGWSLSWLGYTLGTFTGLAWVLALGLRIEEVAKHLHEFTNLLGFILVGCLVAYIIGELFTRRTSKMFWSANREAKQDTLGTGFLLRVLRYKPTILLVFVAPAAVVLLAIFEWPNIGRVEENIVLFAEDGRVRMGDGVYLSKGDAFGEDAMQVRECSLNHFAHAARGVRNLPTAYGAGNSLLRSDSWDYTIGQTDLVVHAAAHWAVVLTATLDRTLGKHVFALPSGEQGMVEAVFPHARVTKTGLVTIPEAHREVYQKERTGTERADFHYQDDGTVRATDRVESGAASAGGAIASAWGWIGGKSVWAFVWLGVFLFVFSSLTAYVSPRVAGVGFVLTLISALLAFAVS